MILKGTDPDRDKPIFLRAVEMLVAAPTDVRKTAEACYDAVAVKPENRARSAEDLRVEAANAIIERYAKTCARVGAVTSLGASIPGIGLVVTLVGAATADLVITMKYQIEMVMALACLFDRDIEDEEQQRLCYTVAGLGVATQAGLLTFENFTVKGLREAARRLLKGKAKRWLFELFKKLGIRLTSKGVLKAIPVGVGVTFSYMSNRKLTRYIGRRARDFFIEELKDDAGQTVGVDDPLPVEAPSANADTPPAPDVSIALELHVEDAPSTDEATTDAAPLEAQLADIPEAVAEAPLTAEATFDPTEATSAEEEPAVAARQEGEPAPEVIEPEVIEPEIVEPEVIEPEVVEPEVAEVLIVAAEAPDAPQAIAVEAAPAPSEAPEEITEDDVDAFMADLDAADVVSDEVSSNDAASSEDSVEEDDDPERLLH